MPSNEFISRLKSRIAVSAVGPSTLRSQGAAGVVAAARSGLQRLDLTVFSAVADEEAFRERLEEATLELQSRFPEPARSWGGPRKALNIFLRDAVCNIDLSSHLGLCGLRPWLEVPLDRYVAEGLQTEQEGADLPQWRGIKHLCREVSAQYQGVASTVAKRKQIQRVDLDVFYWRADAALPEDEKAVLLEFLERVRQRIVAGDQPAVIRHELVAQGFDVQVVEKIITIFAPWTAGEHGLAVCGGS
jgi:hypothetical protein